MTLLDVARAFVIANEELEGATGPRAGELAILSMAARHDLHLLCGAPCDCDEGTCPGLIISSALILNCGHVADQRERLRPGDEKWCGTCAQWRPAADVAR